MKNNLKQIRKVKSITQQQLADSLKVTKAMISMWENNSNEKIPQRRVKQICNYLKIEEEELFTRELDIQALESKALKEEIAKLEQRFYQSEEEKNNYVVKKLKTYHQEIDTEISYIDDDTYKLEQVTKFLKIMNNTDFTTKLDGIQPYGFNALIDRFMSLLEEQNIAKLDIILKVLTFLAIDINTEPNHKAELFNEYDDFNSAFGEFLNANGYKL